MQVFALRHKATGLFMPAKMSRTGARGWSHWSPGAMEDGAPYDKHPRLFFSRKGADNSRALWAAGVHVRHCGATSGTPDNPPEYYDETTIIAPPIPRHRDDLEVVAYELKED